MPVEGAKYYQNQPVTADYKCDDETGGSGIKSCVGPVADGAAIDTSTLGTKTFTVNAEDNAGNESRLTHTYSVVSSSPAPPPVKPKPPGNLFGSLIVFSSNRVTPDNPEGDDEIFTMDSGDTIVQQLTKNGTSDIGPAWSPDCTQIAFVSQRDGQTEIYKMKADGTQQTNLTNTQRKSRNLRTGLRAATRSHSRASWTTSSASRRFSR
jgi:hypothetical protein